MTISEIVKLSILYDYSDLNGEFLWFVSFSLIHKRERKEPNRENIWHGRICAFDYQNQSYMCHELIMERILKLNGTIWTREMNSNKCIIVSCTVAIGTLFITDVLLLFIYYYYLMGMLTGVIGHWLKRLI